MQIYKPGSKTANDYEEMLYVFKFNGEPIWNVGNLIRAVGGDLKLLNNFESFIKHKDLDKYERMWQHSHLNSMWVDSKNLMIWLKRCWPDGNHRLSWWTGWEESPYYALHN